MPLHKISEKDFAKWFKKEAPMVGYFDDSENHENDKIKTLIESVMKKHEKLNFLQIDYKKVGNEWRKVFEDSSSTIFIMEKDLMRWNKIKATEAELLKAITNVQERKKTGGSIKLRSRSK